MFLQTGDYNFKGENRRPIIHFFLEGFLLMLHELYSVLFKTDVGQPLG